MLMRRNSIPCFLALFLLFIAAMAPAGAPKSPGDRIPRFSDVTAASGISFKHWIGEKRINNILQTVAPGLGWFDYNNDGYLDLYCVQSGRLPGAAPRGPEPRNVLYRSNRDGTFTDVTHLAKVGSAGYGMGAAFGDYDNDGWVDIYVTNYGSNVLYHNNGDGTFGDVTARAEVGGSGWSTGATFFDYDNDGYLDLYVAHYVDYKRGAAAKRSMLSEREAYRYFPGPRDYHGESGALYHNNRDGTFANVTRQAGLHRPEGKGLGVVAVDYNGDGWVDLLVANDRAPTNLFRNNQDGTFTDVALEAGIAFDDNGNARGSMGVDAAHDGDGRLQLVVTNMVAEGTVLYRSTGNGGFDDVSQTAKIAEPSYRFIGWGVALLDYNNDSHLDLMSVNGHVHSYIDLFSDSVSYAQEALLFENLGNNVFANRSNEVGRAFSTRRVARGAAFGDYDNDGDIDVAIATANGPVVLLRNDGGNRNNWIQIKLIGGRSNRDAIGARVWVTAGGRTRVADAKGGSSYLSQNDPRLHFGLGHENKVEQVRVRFPSGALRVLGGLPVNRVFVVREDDDSSQAPDLD